MQVALMTYNMILDVSLYLERSRLMAMIGLDRMFNILGAWALTRHNRLLRAEDVIEVFFFDSGDYVFAGYAQVKHFLAVHLMWEWDISDLADKATWRDALTEKQKEMRNRPICEILEQKVPAEGLVIGL